MASSFAQYGGASTSAKQPEGKGYPGQYQYAHHDVESQELLFPGATVSENALRWGFIRKVYGLVSFQLAITAAVSCLMVFHEPTKQAVLESEGIRIVMMLAPFVGMIPLYCYRHSHPTNLVCLALWTACLSMGVGVACTQFAGDIVVQALLLTAAITTSLTLYTFWGVRQGKDFGVLGPMLFTSLMAMVFWGFMQMFFPMGDTGRFVYSLVGAVIFSAYLVYDTHEIIKRHSLDEYVWASVALYLDIINLFLRMLEILQYLQGGRD